MIKIIRVMAIALILSFLATGLASSLAGYGAYIPITIQNTSATDYTDTRFVYSVPAANLITAGWMQADADDVAMTDSNGNATDTVAGNLSSNSPNWYTGLVNVGAYSSIYDQLWISNPTATLDQTWIGMDTDSNYAVDAPELDITTDLTVETDIYLPALPATEKEIISKEGNYELAVDNTNWIFRVWKAGAAGLTGNVNPNANGTLNQHPIIVGAATAWQAVSDANDATYIASASDTGHTLTDRFTIDTSVIPLGVKINSVTVYIRVYANGCGGGANFGFYPLVYLNSATVLGAASYPPDRAWTNISEALARPSGGTWSREDLDSLQIGARQVLAGCGAADGWVSRIYAVIDYDDTDGGHVSQIAATAGSTKTITCTYDGANMSITDGTLTDTDALVGALYTNDEPLHIGEVTAKLDNTIIADTGVNKLELEYEPDQISATQILDQSGEDNHVTFSLTGNPAGITVTTGAMVISDDAALPAQSAAQLQADAVGEIDGGGTQVDTMHGTGDNSGGAIGEVISAFGEVVDPDQDEPFYNVSTAWLLFYLGAVFLVFMATFIAFKEPWISTIAVGIVAGFFVAMTSADQLIPWGMMLLTDLGMAAWAMINTKKVAG